MNRGDAIGPYTIVSPLGAGGMGEVYRARDSKLKREVAIKVLPADVANDRERLARFQREAEVLASLNHPHIAHVYGIEENALVMELVEGEDLSQRIARGPIPIDEALPIAKQIAEALEAAHDAGIIHRDLKPANIKVRDDGTVKVLDFGLAKAVVQDLKASGPQDLVNSPTITSPAMTMRGVILGTAAYMAPEQAKGKPVDKRADIWAFGCVLYEMLTGKRAFKGDDVTDIITSVMRDAPDWSTLPATTPPPIRTLLRRCLEKDPRNRAGHMSIARLEIDEVMTSTGELVHTATTTPTRGLSYTAAALIAIACMGIAAGGAWMMRRPPDTVKRSLIRASYPLADVTNMRLGLQRKLLAITPNSRALVALSNGLLIRGMDQLEWTVVPDTLDATSVFASPNDDAIGFLTRGGIWTMNLPNGKPTLIAQLPDTANLGAESATWADDGRIYFTDRTGLHVVPAAGGKIETILLAGDLGVVEALPGGRGLIYSNGRAQANPSLHLRMFGGGEDVRLTVGLSPQFLAPDLLFFVRGTTLMGTRIDLDGRRLIGEPMPLAEDIAVMSTAAQYDLATDGTLVHVSAAAVSGGNSIATLRKPDGKTVALQDTLRAYSDPRLSPDGKKVAFHVTDQDNDVWVFNLARGALTRMTFEPTEDETPAWSPDGQWLAFAGYVRGSDVERAVFRRRADGTGTEDIVWKGPNHSHVTDWSPDGRWLLLEVADPKRRSDVVLVDLTTGSAKPLLSTDFNESSGRVSPDGKWIAYLSEESGRREIYVQPFPNLGEKIQISTNGGEQPVWSRDGHRLFFRTETAFMSARIESSGGAIQASVPAALFPDTYMRPQAVNHTTYEVFPDGSLLVFAAPPTTTKGGGALIAVFNWLDDAREKIK